MPHSQELPGQVANHQVMEQRRVKLLLLLTVGLLLVAVYFGVTWRQARQLRGNRDLFAAIKRLDVEGTAAALRRGADPNAHSSPPAASRLLSG